MNAENARYPDLSAIFAAKRLRRRELAALSWEAKVAIIERMRRLRPPNGWRRKDQPTRGEPQENVRPASP